MAKQKRRSSAYQIERQQYWQTMITKWRQSGLSQATFCRRHQLQTQQFSKWKLHLAKAAGTASKKPTVQPDFIEIKPSAFQHVYEIITPDDYRIRIEGACGPDVLSEILSAVRPSC